MAIIITDECINCGACEPECPNTAIYEGAIGDIRTALNWGRWFYLMGLKWMLMHRRRYLMRYYIVPGKCTECKGFHDEPQCAAVCPVDCCIPDDEHVETEETLLSRQAFCTIETEVERKNKKTCLHGKQVFLSFF
jgi:ferredoxin